MPPATTLDDVLGTIAEMRKENASVREQIGELSKAQFPGAHMGGDGASLGYWDTTSRPKTIRTQVRTDGRHRVLPRSLPKSYKNESFGSAGEFYRLLVKDKGEFQQRHGAVMKSIQGMSTQVAADGGSWILPEYSDQIIDRVYQNDLWQRTDGYTVAGNNLTFKANAETSRANGSRHGGLRAYWTNEGNDATASKIATRDITLKLNKLVVMVYLTDELIEDAGPALEQYINSKATQEFEFMLGDAVINGTGVGMPLGILNSLAFLAIAKESGQAAATIVPENIDKMWARRIVGGDYVWLTNQDTHPELANMSRPVGTAGELVYNPQNGLQGAPLTGLKGAPQIDTEFNSTLGTLGDILLADFGQYATITKGGISQAASMHVEFVSGQMALRFTMRVDGRPVWAAPTTPFKGSNTQSYFLGLATRS